MWYIRLNFNFTNPDGEELEVGPYYFDTWEERKTWERLFKEYLEKLNFEMKAVKGHRLTAVCCFGSSDSEETMLPPHPEEVVNNLRTMWENGTIYPKAALRRKENS